MLTERYREEQKRRDRRAGEIVATLLNGNGAAKDREAFGWTDIFAEWQDEAPEQDEEQMLEAMLMWTKATEGLSH